MQKGLISIIVPVYNVQEYLEKCINSILEQSYDNYEILLIDDGSTDSSGEICDNYKKKYPEQIDVVHQENMGLGAARNTGIERARGEYFFFLDSDDYIDNNTMEILADKIENTNADLVIFNMRTVDTEGKIIRVSKLNLPEDVFSLDSCRELILVQPSAWGKVYHRDLFLENAIRFPERVCYEDIWVAYKIFVNAKRVVKCDAVLYNYVMRQGSIMNSGKIKQNLEIFDAYNEVKKYLKENNMFDKYKEELEYLVVDNVFVGTSIRVLLIDKKSIILREIKEYVEKNYRGYMSNTYLRKNKMERGVCLLLKYKLYGLVKIMIRIKRKLEGYEL